MRPPSRLGPALAAAAVLAAAAAGGPADGRAPRAAVYSDACRTAESGDIAGHSVRISGLPDAPRVSFSWSDGQVRGPATAHDVRYTPSDRSLSFVVLTPDGQAVFNGRLTPGSLVGRLKDGWEVAASPVRLARVAAAGVPACRSGAA